MLVITGGAGFIGSALLWEFNRRGIEDILVVDNLGESGKWLNLCKRAYIDYIHKDEFIRLVRNNSLPENVEAIVHLGACSSTTEKDADFLMENNFHYSRDLGEYAIARNIRFLNASSAATYGSGGEGFDDNPDLLKRLRPLNMYGYSKHLFDLWLARQNFPHNVASLKFFNVFGPNEYHKGQMQSVAVKLFRQIGATGKAELFASGRTDIADGEQKRDFVYVKDCARLLADLVLERRDIGGIRNVGSGNARSFKELAKAVFAAMGRTEYIGYKPMPPELASAYQYYTQANMTWMERENFPFRFTAMENAVKDYVQNYLSEFDPYL